MDKNIYSERVYLVGDEDAKKVFFEKRIHNEMIWTVERQLYKDILAEYKKLIKLTAKLLKSMDLSDSLEYSLALSYMIREGFLSKSLDFTPGEPDNEIKSKYGINIVTGEGCCRNCSDFHKDVMQELDRFVMSFYCVTGKTMHQAIEVQANHVLNLISYDKNLYGIDIYNADKLFYFKTAFILKEISHYFSSMLRYKPYYELTVSKETYENMIDNIMMFNEESKKRHLSPYEYHDTIVAKMSEYLKGNRSMFLDFHHETKDIKDNICDGMQRKLMLQQQLTKES